MTCTICGHKIHHNENNCGNCGADVMEMQKREGHEEHVMHDGVKGLDLNIAVWPPAGGFEE